MNYSLGADPEVFVGNAAGVRSIIGMIGGTKSDPMPLPIGKGFAVQEDNVALEFNIPASHSKGDFIKNINMATGFLEKTMTDRYGLQFVKASAVSFPSSELEHPMALMFGCDPDFNVWTSRANKRPSATDSNLRSCGGHVHIGCTDLDPHEIIKACDLFLGVPSVLMDNGDLRKQLYGKAGAFRQKHYGVEYRTLSNFWIFEDRLIGWVHDNVGRALDAVSSKLDFDHTHKDIVRAINTNNKVLAAQIVNEYQLQIV